MTAEIKVISFNATDVITTSKLNEGETPDDEF